VTQSIAQSLADAMRTLAACSDSPRADAEILLAHQLGWSRAQLFARAGEPLHAVDAEGFQRSLQRRVRAEPVAYITGEKGFWTLSLKVGPAVLVPRPETELLVEWALQRLSAVPQPRLADLGTGSGCIALALAAERPDASIVAMDISTEALALAAANAAQLQLANLRFVQAGFGEFLAQPQPPFDLLVSNPPYIAAQDAHLHDLRHEPLQALTDGADGLQCLREIVAAALPAVRAGGWLLLEHGFDQGAAVRALLEAAGFTGVETRRDLAGQERASGGYRP